MTDRPRSSSRTHSRDIILATVISCAAFSTAVPVSSADNSSESSGTTRSYVQGDPAAPSLEAELALDRTELPLEARLTLRIRVSTPADGSLKLPEYDKLFDGWTIASSQTRETYDGLPPRRMVNTTIVLEPFLPGDKSVPALTFSFEPGARGQRRVVQTTDPIPVRVFSRTPSDAPKLDPLAAPEAKAFRTLNLPVSDDDRLRWAAIGAGAAFGVAMLLLIIRAIFHRPAKPFDPVAHALAELARIQNELPTRSGPSASQDAAAALSANLRTVLSVRLGLPTSNRTTQELAHTLSTTERLPESLRTSARDVLNQLELAAFSPAGVDHSRVSSLADKTLALARSVVPQEARR
jgi:hypothetical protein